VDSLLFFTKEKEMGNRVTVIKDGYFKGEKGTIVDMAAISTYILTLDNFDENARFVFDKWELSFDEE
jgi:hypothetical protein